MAGSNATASVEAERPIISAAQDNLQRRSFAARIADAAISRATTKATGVVIGLTGPWGSGKSSLLNLVAEYVDTAYPTAFIVRFDPWVVSGRNDLISVFLKQLISTIGAEPKNAKAYRNLLQRLAEYGELVSPIINLAAPGGGSFFKAAANKMSKAVSKDESLDGLRKQLARDIADVGRPILVLIDEVDRLEDSEVQAIAQLVRSVADFSGISYVLAYDAHRVEQALGGGDIARGRAYLEKIIQLAIPIPILLNEELRALLDSEVAAAVQVLGWEALTDRAERYSILAEALVPQLISTPRDVKRVVGTFLPIASMLEGEVDPIDILGFAALLAKAPRTADNIRLDPERCILDPLSYAEHARRRSAGPNVKLLEGVLDRHELYAEALLLRLFPALNGQVGRAEGPADGIGGRRGLLTVLRFGVVPGAASRNDVLALLAAPRERARDIIKSAVQEDALSPLIERLEDTYPSMIGMNDLDFWLGAADVLNDPDLSVSHQGDVLRSTARRLAALLVNAVAERPDQRAKAVGIFSALNDERDLALVPIWLYNHFFVYGLFKARPAGGDRWFLSIQEVNNLAGGLAHRWRDSTLQGELLFKLPSLYPILVMTFCGVWDQQTREYAGHVIDRVLLRFVLLFGGANSPPFELIDEVFGSDRFKKALKIKMMGIDDLAAHEKSALLSANEHVSGESQ